MIDYLKQVQNGSATYDENKLINISGAEITSLTNRGANSFVNFSGAKPKQTDLEFATELNTYTINVFKATMYCIVLQEAVSINKLETDSNIAFSDEVMHMANTEILIVNQTAFVQDAISYIRVNFIGNAPYTCG